VSGVFQVSLRATPNKHRTYLFGSKQNLFVLCGAIFAAIRRASSFIEQAGRRSQKQRVCRLTVQIPVSVLHVAIRENGEIIRVGGTRNTIDLAGDVLLYYAVLFAGVKINVLSICLDYW
jgi:hypothetical protein